MNKRILTLSELFGVFFCLAVSLFLLNFYHLSGGSTLGAVFGAVNGSVWERVKCAALPYMLFGLLELFCAKPPFKSFVTSKALGLLAVSVFGAAFNYFTAETWLASLLTLAAGFGVCFVSLLSGARSEVFFALSVFFIAFLFVSLFCFSAFPPRLGLFRDPATGLYGVIPTYFDYGAVALQS